MSALLEERVRELELDAVERRVQVEFLVKVVEDNTSAIKQLTAVLNKGKGAAWAMAGVYTLFGGAVATFVSWVRG
jgi:hypothetical protein